MRSDILDFFDIIPAAGFDVPFQEAVDRFKDKGLKPSFAWQDVMRDEHKASFTIAKMMDVDLLADVKASMDDAIAQGLSFTDWSDQMIPMLQSKGWWGRKAVLDPLTGQTVVAQLGSPARLQTIFRTNMSTAYSAGHWDMIEDQAEDAPYLMYDAIDDYRTRPAHAAWDGLIRPVTDSFWKMHTPPCGWNCRCSVIQMDAEDLERFGMSVSKPPATQYYEWTNPRTGKTIKVPKGVDPGFGHAAASRVDNLRKLLDEKVVALPNDMQKAAEAAIAEMDKALADKTPYLSTAIKGLAAKNPDLDPITLLNEAKAKAAKAKQSTWLSEYKAAITTGKKPAASAQKAFDALPQEAQLALIKDIEQKSALLKAEAEAVAKLDALTAATPTSATGKAIAELKKANELDGLTAAQQVDKIEAKMVEVKAKANQSSLLSSYKANIVAGKVPSANQKAAFDALPDDQKEAFLAKMDKEKAKKAPPAPPPEPQNQPAIEKAGGEPLPAPRPDLLDGQNLTQIGPQKGSNPGGLFQDTETGEKWYIKFPDSMERARNELLTAKLYQLGGIDAPEYKFVTVNGQKGIASKFVEGLEQNKAALTKLAPGVADGFGMDAWLANWDVVGANFDNMLVNGKKAFRVDTGGGMLYRAQGGAKGSAWDNAVDEIDSLRDKRINPQAAQVFAKLSDQQIEEGVRRVLRIRDADIEQLVDKYGPADLTERVKLAETLIARKAALAKRFPNAKPEVKAADVTDANSAITALEQKTIEASRANGYAIRTDKDQIEDHNVIVSVFKSGNGPVTRTHMKLTEAAGRRIEKDIAKRAGEATAVVTGSETVRGEILQLIKGVNSRAAKGEAFDQKNIDRWNTLEPKISDYLQSLQSASVMKGVDVKLVEAQDAYLRDWYVKLRDTMNKATAASKASKIDGMFEQDKITDILRKAEVEDVGIAWQRLNSLDNRIAKIERGHSMLTDGKQDVPGVDRAFTAEIDGAKVTYIPFDGNSNGRSFQGTLIIDKPGQSTTVTGDSLNILERLGINARRATDDDRLELYLNKHARLYTVKDSALKKEYDALSSIDDQADRIAKKTALVNKAAGKDITQSDQFGTYTGRYQAFGHGRAHQYRADLDDAEFNQFAKDYVIYNNPTGLGTDAHGPGMLESMKTIIETGGQYVSRADMVRRGMPMRSGTSVSADIRTGGGNYIFTRIRSKRATKGAGIYWKPNVMRRLDGISYAGDNFGNTAENALAYRKTKIDEWREIAGNSSNETIFKDGLSVFDDLEVVVFPDKSLADQMIVFMQEHGYSQWPDGRKLEDVITYKGKGK